MECNINLECNISVSTVLYSSLLTLLYCTVLYYTVQYGTLYSATLEMTWLLTHVRGYVFVYVHQNAHGARLAAGLFCHSWHNILSEPLGDKIRDSKGIKTCWLRGPGGLLFVKHVDSRGFYFLLFLSCKELPDSWKGHPQWSQQPWQWDCPDDSWWSCPHFRRA